MPNNCCKISGKWLEALEALLGESNLGRVDGRGSATEKKPAIAIAENSKTRGKCWIP